MSSHGNRKRRLRIPKESTTLKIIGNPITCFVKVEGLKSGRSREFLAAVSPTSRYCVMRRGDAAGLGLATTSFPRPYPGTGTMEIAGSLEGISEHEVITIPKMVLANLEATNVETMLVEYSMPEIMGIDVILGSTFFSKKKVVMDYARGIVTIYGQDSLGRTPSALGRKQT